MRYVKYALITALGIGIASIILIFCGKLPIHNPEPLEAFLSIQEDPNLIFLIDKNEAQTLTITNRSPTVTALGIVADLGNTLLTAGISQTPGTECANLAPGASCTISFLASARPIGQTSFQIYGTNTSKVDASITVVNPNPNVANIIMDPPNVTFSENKDGSTLTVKIKNTTPITAKQITVDTTPWTQFLKDHITFTTDNGCASLDYRENALCIITFKYIKDPIGFSWNQAPLKIFGKNTTEISGNITTEGAKIDVLNGSAELIFRISDTTPQILKIQNSADSLTGNITAKSIIAGIQQDVNDRFTIEYSSCTDVVPHSSTSSPCTITFTPKTGKTLLENPAHFSIYGTNTTIIPASIAVMPDDYKLAQITAGDTILEFDENGSAQTIVITNTSPSPYDADVQITSPMSESLSKMITIDPALNKTFTIKAGTSQNITVKLIKGMGWMSEVKFTISAAPNAKYDVTPINGSITIGTPTITMTPDSSELKLISGNLGGKPKTVKITNTSKVSTIEQINVTDLANLKVSKAVNCSPLSPSTSCDLTFTGTGPSNGNLAITGATSAGESITNTINLKVNVIDYGSDYQGGYLFDATVVNDKISGKVVARHGVGCEILNRSFDAADAFCQSYNVDSFTGWRLPTICEIGKLPTTENFKCDRTDSNILNKLGSQYFYIKNGTWGIWSSTQDTSNSNKFWTYAQLNDSIGILEFVESHNRNTLGEWHSACCVREFTDNT